MRAVGAPVVAPAALGSMPVPGPVGPPRLGAAATVSGLAFRTLLTVAGARGGAGDPRGAAVAGVARAIHAQATSHPAFPSVPVPREGAVDEDERGVRTDRGRRRAHGADDPAAPPTAVAAPIPRAPLAAPDGAVSHAPVASLEDLLPALVRRVAWSGDRHRGTVRLEIGTGPLDGSTLLVDARGDRVRVRLDVPPGVDTRGWEDRIRARLTARGLPADDVEVA